jgi:hypothetical protein
MEYNLPKKDLNERYITHLFGNNLEAMDDAWKKLHCKIKEDCGAIDKIPEDIRDILTADYSKLVDIFRAYLNLEKLRKKTEEKIIKLFDYKKYQPKIAEFFMDPENKFQIHVCHYCGIAYINAYGIQNDYGDKYAFIKNASREELKKFIPGNLSDKTIDKIIKERESFTSLDDFDRLSCWRSEKKSDSIKVLLGNHFDIDHELAKTSCPLLALSLYNFVPSCPTCNQKLKRSSTIGSKEDRTELIKLSPTSDEYDFDRNVLFYITPKRMSTFGFLRNLEEYRIDMKCHDKSFEKSIGLFRLKQRYNYHKVFALRLLDLKERYSPGSIKMISNLLQGSCSEKYTEEQIREDIFGEEYSKVGHRAFDKLRRDILK